MNKYKDETEEKRKKLCEKIIEMLKKTMRRYSGTKPLSLEEIKLIIRILKGLLGLIEEDS